MAPPFSFLPRRPASRICYKRRRRDVMIAPHRAKICGGSLRRFPRRCGGIVGHSNGFGEVEYFYNNRYFIRPLRGRYHPEYIPHTFGVLSRTESSTAPLDAGLSLHRASGAYHGSITLRPPTPTYMRLSQLPRLCRSTPIRKGAADVSGDGVVTGRDGLEEAAVVGAGDAEVAPGQVGDFAAAGGALQEALLYEEGFVDVLDGAGVLA